MLCLSILQKLLYLVQSYVVPANPPEAVVPDAKLCCACQSSRSFCTWSKVMLCLSILQKLLYLVQSYVVPANPPEAVVPDAKLCCACQSSRSFCTWCKVMLCLSILQKLLYWCKVMLCLPILQKLLYMVQSYVVPVNPPEAVVPGAKLCCACQSSRSCCT